MVSQLGEKHQSRNVPPGGHRGRARPTACSFGGICEPQALTALQEALTVSSPLKETGHASPLRPPSR